MQPLPGPRVVVGGQFVLELVMHTPARPGRSAPRHALTSPWPISNVPGEDMKDATLGGYLREHERPPAFEGPGGHSYTVEIMVDRGGPSAWCGYLFFVRWEGNEAVGHLESEFLSGAETEEEARAALEKLTLHEVKQLLDGLASR